MVKGRPFTLERNTENELVHQKRCKQLQLNERRDELENGKMCDSARNAGPWNVMPCETLPVDRAAITLQRPSTMFFFPSRWSQSFQKIKIKTDWTELGRYHQPAAADWHLRLWCTGRLALPPGSFHPGLNIAGTLFRYIGMPSSAFEKMLFSSFLVSRANLSWAFQTLPYWKGSRKKKKWKRRWWKTIAPFSGCLTRKFVFFVTRRLSQTAKNKRFETTSLRHTSELRRTHLCQIAGRIEWIVNPKRFDAWIYTYTHILAHNR